MRRLARVTLVTATILAGAFGLATSASALTADDVIGLYGEVYDVVSVVPSETDPSVYVMTVMIDGVSTVFLVDVATGDIIAQDEPQAPTETAATDPAEKGECFAGGWDGLGFRNQGQCVRFVNTGADTRPWRHPHDEESGAGSTAAATEGSGGTGDCRDGGWEDLGYRNQGQCIAGH